MPVVCVAEFVGGGGGATTPVVSVCPAITETAIVRLSIATAVNRRKVFTLSASQRFAKILQFRPAKHDLSARTLQGLDVLRYIRARS